MYILRYQESTKHTPICTVKIVYLLSYSEGKSQRFVVLQGLNTVQKNNSAGARANLMYTKINSLSIIVVDQNF